MDAGKGKGKLVKARSDERSKEEKKHSLSLSQKKKTPLLYRNYAPRSLLLSRVVAVAPATGDGQQHTASTTSRNTTSSNTEQATPAPLPRRLGAAAGVRRPQCHRRGHRAHAGRGPTGGAGRVRQGADASRHGPEAVQVRARNRAQNKSKSGKKKRKKSKIEKKRLVS